MADFRGQRRGANRVGGGGASVTGADDLLKLSKKLKATGQTELRRELHKAMRATAQPLARKVKASAAENIGQHRGGIGEHYGKKPVRAQVRTGAKTAGVRLVMPKTDPRVDAQGRVAHPVFGRPRSTVVQMLPDLKGFFSDAAREHGENVVRDDLRRVLEDYTERVFR